MWTISEILIAMFLCGFSCAILIVLVRAFYPNRVIPDEREDFDDYRDTPETRYRKASGEQ
jgi:hypothetical protein